MKVQHRYYGQSRAENSATATSLSFVPDTLRQPVYFVGHVSERLPFREAISALHDVVVSDLRTRPKDRGAYFEWLRNNEEALFAEFMSRERALREKAGTLTEALRQVRAQKEEILGPFKKAQRRYFDYLYAENRDAWIVLDPVITVHPDRIFFECFSRDESSYASLSCSHNIFKHRGEFSCGTTNIDYSADLYEEFQKIRDYKTTQLAIEPTGFTIQSEEDPAFIEQKIDLPDSWVRGFLQVSSAMTLPAHTLHLHPMDIYNLCFKLRRKKERVGPRSLRFILQPDKPIRIIFEPWNDVLVCPRSIYTGTQADEVRVWGRRRLLTLERLIPVSERFTVHLLGYGLPSFWIAEMPDMQYTLGLSGWTANDWSRAGQFDLLAPRRHVAKEDIEKVYAALATRWVATEAELSQACLLDPATVVGAMTLLTQAGRAIYDLTQQAWRHRELSLEPLPLETLRFVSAEEEAAAQLLQENPNIPTEINELPDHSSQIRSRVKAGKKVWNILLRLDADDRLVDAYCECPHYTQHRLRRGPCQHMLAVRQSIAARRILIAAPLEESSTC